MNPVTIPFQMTLPSELLRISAVFEKNSKELYVVGGAVRDALLGLSPKDYDVATNATPDEVVAMFHGSHYTILEIGKAFGVIKLVTPSNGEYEIATFRSDVGAGRRPESVVFTTIEEDVKRRDLTINALFYNIQKSEVVDFVGGIEDLNNKVIRAVGNPHERFAEDRLRILRALRFAARFNSQIHPETAEAIMNQNMENPLEGVSSERIRDEFVKGIQTSHSVVGFVFSVAEHIGFKPIFPGLTIDFSVSESRSVPVQVALLLHENEPWFIAKALNELKYSAVECAQVAFLVSMKTLSVETAYRLKKGFNNSHLTESELFQFAHAIGTLGADLMEAFLKFELTVTGAELLEEGLKGQEIGRQQELRETRNFSSLLR
jgi:tRNA nucleotidyltransferase/poly(A) polymerase